MFCGAQNKNAMGLNKINSNKANDAKAVIALKKDGGKIITIRECNLKSAKVERTISVSLKKPAH
jgi:G:T-mismatch repair DNA endonuclease (very short patch repair protein)